MRSTETIKVNPLIFRFKPEDEEKNLKIETQNRKLEMKVSVIKIRCKNGKNIENKKKKEYRQEKKKMFLTRSSLGSFMKNLKGYISETVHTVKNVLTDEN